MGHGGGREAQYAAAIRTKPAALGAPTTEAVASVSILDLPTEQVQKLLGLIDTPKGGYKNLSGTIPWLIDSDASCHMTGNLRIMEEAKKFSPF